MIDMLQQRQIIMKMLFEAIMMNLRMNEGINIKEFDERFDCNILRKTSFSN